MHVHVNYCFCTDSIWGGDFVSNFMVCIPKYLPSDDALKGKKHEDWKRLVDEIPRATRKMFESLVTNRLKPEVLNWLKENIRDNGKEKGFAIGSDEYNSHGSMDFSIWFYRRSDAMKFIKQWSACKKPTTYFDYFRGIRKQYNPETKTLQKVEKLEF
jgi:hypothetical protein